MDLEDLYMVNHVKTHVIFLLLIIQTKQFNVSLNDFGLIFLSYGELCKTGVFFASFYSKNTTIYVYTSVIEPVSLSCLFLFFVACFWHCNHFDS